MSSEIQLMADYFHVIHFSSGFRSRSDQNALIIIVIVGWLRMLKFIWPFFIFVLFWWRKSYFCWKTLHFINPFSHFGKIKIFSLIVNGSFLVNRLLFFYLCVVLDSIQWGMGLFVPIIGGFIRGCEESFFFGTSIIVDNFSLNRATFYLLNFLSFFPKNIFQKHKSLFLLGTRRRC